VALGLGNFQIFADAACEKSIDFSVAWHCRDFLLGAVYEYGMRPTFAQ
jgi:hypothetical protein